jgi:uncharacterized protein with GYD domain
MPTYISLYRWTQQGIANIKDSPKRVEAFQNQVSNLGAELKSIYLVMGQYDFVATWDAPDDETAARIALSLGSQGNVRSETMRAFTGDEFRKIIGSLP